MKRAKKKRMYAISAEGIGLIAGTLAYSRKNAIEHFMAGATHPASWQAYRHSGYRTVQAMVEITKR